MVVACQWITGRRWSLALWTIVLRHLFCTHHQLVLEYHEARFCPGQGDKLSARNFYPWRSNEFSIGREGSFSQAATVSFLQQLTCSATSCRIGSYLLWSNTVSSPNTRHIVEGATAVPLSEWANWEAAWHRPVSPPSNTNGIVVHLPSIPYSW